MLQSVIRVIRGSVVVIHGRIGVAQRRGRSQRAGGSEARVVFLSDLPIAAFLESRGFPRDV
jgi:hypothetical protein